MLRITAIILLQMAVGGALRAEEAAKDAGDSQKLSLLIRRVPPGFISGPEPATAGSQTPVTPNQIDATEFFKQSGVSFPKGAFALFDHDSSIILLRNTPENLDLADYILGGGGCYLGAFACVNVEISTYECTFASPQDKILGSLPSFADLVRLPRGAIRLLDQVSVLESSGRPFEMERVSLKHLPSTAPEKKSGTTISGESILGPDGETFSTKISYRFCPPGKANSEFRFEGRFDSLTDRPVVIFSAPFAGIGRKMLIVTARTRPVSFLYDGSPDTVDASLSPTR